MEYYKIDHNPMPAAVEITPSEEELYSDSTGRDEMGVTHLDLVRAGVNKLQIRHEMLTDTELATIKNAIDPATKPKGVTVTAFGKTFRAYVGPRQYLPKVVGPSEVYWQMTYSLVEI